MSNVISINSQRKFNSEPTGFFSYNGRDSFEQTFLLLGAVIFVTLPLIVSLTNFGMLTFVTGSLLSGVLIGWLRFRYFPYKKHINEKIVPEIITREIVELKKAA